MSGIRFSIAQTSGGIVARAPQYTGYPAAQKRPGTRPGQVQQGGMPCHNPDTGKGSCVRLCLPHDYIFANHFGNN